MEQHHKTGSGDKHKRGANMKCLLLLLTIIYLVGSTNAAYNCSPNCYVVPSGGSDSNDGTFASPWATPTYAATQLNAGDTVYLIDGVWNDESVDFTNSGNSTHQITFQSYNGTPTLNNTATTENGIIINNKSWIIIKDIVVSNYVDASLNNGVGIYVMAGSNNIIIDNVTTFDNKVYGILLALGSHDNVVKNSTS